RQTRSAIYRALSPPFSLALSSPGSGWPVALAAIGAKITIRGTGYDMRRLALVALALLVGLGSAAVFASAASPAASAAPTPAPWPMFHRNEQHTGVITDAAGDILPGTGPLVRWTYQVYTPT